jgi:hypothetical protein
MIHIIQLGCIPKNIIVDNLISQVSFGSSNCQNPYKSTCLKKDIFIIKYPTIEILSLFHMIFYALLMVLFFKFYSI